MSSARSRDASSRAILPDARAGLKAGVFGAKDAGMKTSRAGAGPSLASASPGAEPWRSRLALARRRFRQAPSRPRIRFERVSGLSQSAVNCIYQDRHGFMWFGTEDGLNRFDGYAFGVFRRQPGDPASLSHNFVWAVTEDAEGGLWVGTEGGLHRRAPGSTDFVRLRHDPRDETTVGSDFIWALLRDRRGAVWVGTKGGGLSRYDGASGRFTPLPPRPGPLRLAAPP